MTVGAVALPVVAATMAPAEKSSTAMSGATSGAMSMITVMLALVAVVLMIMATAWIIKRFTGLTPLNNKQIKIVASVSLGARERLVLVEVGEQQLLLGVTPQQISNLLVLPEPLAPPDKGSSSDFAQRLQAMLSKGNPQ